VKKEETE